MKQTLLMLLMLPLAARAGNPIIPGYADPHMKIWDGKMYLSVGKDESPALKRFSMIHWAVFSSTNLVDWTLESKVDPADTYLGAGYNRCWASDLARKDGLYYLYTSNGGEETSVFRAEQPGGPFRDILKRPMLAKGMSINHEYDPTVFTEDDGQHYIVFGRDGQLGDHLIHYQMAKLADDMVSIDGKPRDLMTTKPYGFGDKNRARDHQYFHKHNGIYYLSCAGAYMTSTNRYGPFDNERHTGQNGHSSFAEYNGQWYHCNEWTCEPHGVRQYRQVCLTYLHYKDNGDMVSDPAFLQGTSVAKEGIHYRTGVGNYSASWDKIEAEWFFKISGAVKRESPAGGFEIQQVRDGSNLHFPNVADLPANATVTLQLASANPGGRIEIRKDSPSGSLLGSCEIPNTGSWSRYQAVPCPLKNEAGTANLVLVFKGGADDLLHLDWFGF